MAKKVGKGYLLEVGKGYLLEVGKGYLLEVDISYSHNLHDLHNDLPFMCEKRRSIEFESWFRVIYMTRSM